MREAVARLIAVGRPRYAGFSHFEADDCGALNEWRAAAPQAEPVCGRIAAMLSTNELAARPARSPTERCSLWAGTAYAGSTRRTRRTVGTAGS